MSERDAFESILAALHEVALDRSQWSRAAALIHETVGTCGSSMMFGEGADQEDVRIHFAWTFYGGERHRELERLLLRQLLSPGRTGSRVRNLPDGHLFHNTDLYTEKERKTSAAYNALRTFRACGKRPQCPPGRI